VLRPILPQMAWQAITAFAGFFTLVAALATPVDLWRLAVHSHQGEPFRATATLASRPDEHISTACLSMGPESDAPDSGMPFLKQADLEFNPARGTVDISTREPVVAPALALVLRVQCAGAPLYARHFTALVPPPVVKAASAKTATTQSTAAQSTAAQSNAAPSTPAKPATANPGAAPVTPGAAQLAQTQQRAPAKRPGLHLSLLPGDSVASIAAVLFPGRPQVQQRLIQQVIDGNPRIFPDGRAREVPAGTVLWFPDLHDLRKSSIEKPETQAAGPAATPRAAPPASVPATTQPPQLAPKPRSRITLRRALALGDRPGAQECRQLMQLCGAEPAATAASPALEEKARTLESGVQQLRLKQDSIDQQLLRIEQSIQMLQTTIAAAPAQPVPPPLPAPAPPRVEIRTVVKSEPVPWYIWLGFAGLVVMAGLAGVAFGRRGTISRETVENDEQLDRMLATAATAMRELESAPKPVPLPRPPPRRPPVEQVPRPAPAEEPSQPAEEPASASAPPDLLLEPDAAQNMTELDVNLDESAPPEPPQVDGLSSEVLYEMDQALDNTRSMFTDVDRFIALGRTQNALSLLQFQVHKDPKDRDSWIKLLAIYRQEKMDDELARAAREFKRNFPAENLPAV
jgi:hypothetical protein